MKRCPFHRVDPSPWPFLTSWGLGVSAISFAQFLHGDSFYWVVAGLCSTVMCIYWWFVDIVTEATYLGKHTIRVQRGIRIGFCLFLLSESMFFVSFFWAFFHSALSASHVVGCYWPPEMLSMHCKGIPLANTGLLVGTIYPCNVAQKAIKSAQLRPLLLWLGVVMVMGACFVGLQVWEYYTAKFTMADGIYGSCFFALTGLHGLHVVGGLIFLFVAWNRARLGHFSPQRHLNLTFAVWYWHFVDGIWIAVYVFVYIWTGWGWQWSFTEMFSSLSALHSKAVLVIESLESSV
ncbi:cytochrome c oxidase subunit III (mitochondrion) [Mizuhopecten yessoensis]|uniref:Cytochrome c oxidase subunit 3 n=1 Tax=Mizuhopecten yessoensis TaxID=6573 RepID=A3KCM4_MIZYE|nr:cytochrome c oxidase subunit III [Mizuhopecten yessoensis]ACL36042.1 cytochrome c oxidase subunit III [Mizuhopecten yessoensis]BAF47968.1 cytochrome oxidase subunit 3 [Mizuhopecten yessoensis]